MNRQSTRGIWPTLLIARESAPIIENRRFLTDLTHNLPWRWNDRLPRTGNLTDRFPGLVTRA